MFRQFLRLLFFATAFIAVTGNKPFKLTVLHINDFHSRFEESDIRSGLCTKNESMSNLCFGGVARMYKYVTEVRGQEENVLFLNAGNMFQGTIWYSEFGCKPLTEFMNMMNFDAVVSDIKTSNPDLYQFHFTQTLGNHEFDNGIKGLLPFAEKVTFGPLLCANCNLTNATQYAPFVKPYKIVTFGEVKVGIIGYLTRETMVITVYRLRKRRTYCFFITKYIQI